ncbi:MAG: response regulator [Chitinophagaceae bacterium]|nr:response regulator [Chitinophagaceae bacterium]
MRPLKSCHLYIMKQKILLIASEPSIRASISEILELADYNLVQAADGKSGVEMATQECPDIIITELTLSGLDGFGVLHLLQTKPWFGHTVFIVLCSSCDKHELRKAMEMGADDIIIKPIEGTELLSCLETRIRKRELGGLWKKKEEQLYSTAETERELHEYLVKDRNVDRYNKKQLIVKEGERPTRLYYLINGKARAYKTHPDGKDLVIELYGPGDYLGFVEIINGTNHDETVEAIDYTELALIPRKDFEDLISQNTLASRKFMEKIALRNSRLHKRLLWLAYHSLRQKVAAALLHLKDKYGNSPAEHFEINMNRAAFASIAGTAIESSIRTLGEFKAERIIELEHDGTIRLLNEKKLEQLVG